MTDFSAPQTRSDESTPSQDKRTGLFESVLHKILMRPAQVTAVEALGDKFRMITIQGAALQDVQWTPGDKIQVQFGGWVQRTYTPVEWDPVQGSTRILAYLHGESPGAEWARRVRAGDECTFFGPRGSIDLTKIDSPAFVFGDETSIGLVAALRHVQPAAGPVLAALEVTSLQDTQEVVQALGLETTRLVERTSEDSHLSAVEKLALDWVQTHPSASFVLSGKASSIQRIRQFLGRQGIKGRQFHNKAYWAPGKKGLD